ncbi:hypothetical protein C5C50_04170 [Rathayibacter sp. AY1D9]|nr:hypothetical protein C5C50_04170 [Rathayibacter sp. AY1D9]
MAEFHHVSTQTIRTVKRTKTWPGFVLAKQQRTSFIANAKDRKFHDAQKAGLKPVSRSRGVKTAVVDPAEAQLGVDLQMNEKYVPRSEFEDAVSDLNDRLDAQRHMIMAKKNKRTWPWGNR